MALDPSKLKVAELKEQLILRGLDSKGLKAALVQRLQDAIDSEDNGDSRIDAEDDNVEESTSVADDHLLNEEPGVAVDDNLSDGISTHVSAISDDVNRISKDGSVNNSNGNEPDDLSALAPSVTTETGIVSHEVGADETAVNSGASETPESSRCLDSNSEIEADCVAVTEPKPFVATDDPDSQDQSTVVGNNDNVSTCPNEPNECVETGGASTARESAGNEQDVSAAASDANDSVCVKTESAEFNAENSAFVYKDDAVPVVVEPVESVESGDVSEASSVKKEDDDAAPVVEEAMESVESGAVSEASSVKKEDDAVPVVEEAMESVESESVIMKPESVGVECARSGVKRSLSPEHRDVKKANIVRDVSDEPQFDDSKVLLDWYNSDLSLVIDKETLLSASPMSADGFAYMWSGARTTYGFTDGKFCFEVRLTALNNVSHLASEPDPHVLRVGWSADTAGLQLGEEPLSFGYGGTGKFSSDLKFEDYGCRFGEGDVVGAYVDFAADGLVHLYFTVNGQLQGEACSLSRSQLPAAGAALFPHVLTKNTAFELNMGQRPTAWFEHPAELSDYVFCSDAAADRRVRGTLAPATKSDCTVIMMVGLPSCGKTTWLNQHMKQNADKKFNILGTNYLIDRMRVMGLPRKDNYHGRWDQLIATCTRCLNVLLEMAPRRRRNYIIDQTNVYQSAQRRKLRNFDQFRRRAVVVVPDDEEFRRRASQAQQQDGKLVPDSSVMEMKAAFKLPVAGDYLDEVVFAEQQREQAQTLVERYNKEARDAGFLPPWEKHRRRANNSTNTNNGAGGSSQQRHRPSYSGSQTKSAGRSGWQSGGAAAAAGSRGGPGDRQWQRFSGQAGAAAFGGWRRDADRYSGATAAAAAAGGWWSAGAAAARPQQPLQPWATGCYPQQRWGAGSNYSYGNYSYREQQQQQYQQQQQQYQQQYQQQQQQQRGAAGYGQYGRSGWDRNGNQFSSDNNQQYGGQYSYNGHRGGYSRR